MAYSVKQIAEMLGTNQETVRRWIRDGKLQAEQVSRKTGNSVTDEALQRFLDNTPKYLPKSTVVGTSVSPAIGLATLASGIVASALISYFGTKKDSVIRIKETDFKRYLKGTMRKMQTSIQQKKELMERTQKEIEEMEEQIKQYEYLIQNDTIIKEAINKVSTEEG